MRDVVIIGVGQLGGVFAKGFLRLGCRVTPVNRDGSMQECARTNPDPEVVLIAVGEGDLPAALNGLPESWRPRVGLVQNELLPRDWERAEVDEPSVAAVWFEKKVGRPIREILPTMIGGPSAELLCAALHEVGLRSEVVAGEAALVEALVLKNLYILVSNIAGLKVGGNVGQLWEAHRDLAVLVAREVVDVQSALLGQEVDGETLISGLGEAFLADPDHGCCGRSAPKRLARMMTHAEEAGLELPIVSGIAVDAGV